MTGARSLLSAPLELKALTDDGTFEGLASTFGPPADLQGDVIEPGAFAASLAEHRSAGTMPSLLWHHDASDPIGRWDEIRETEAGLSVRGKFTLTVQQAAEAHALLKDGALNGLSIGFRVRESRTGDGDVGRVLTDIELIEISIVTLPANQRARITNVKAADFIHARRQLERFLRDSGISKSDATWIASGWTAPAQRDSEGDGSKALAGELRSAIRILESLTENLNGNPNERPSRAA